MKQTKTKKSRVRTWSIVSISLIAFFLIVTYLAETIFQPLLFTFLARREIKTFGGGIYYTSEYEDKEESLEKTNELNDKVTTLRIESQNQEMRRLLEQTDWFCADGESKDSE